MTRPQTSEPRTGDNGYPLRDEATQPWPQPATPVEPGGEELYAALPPAARRRRLFPGRTPWPWILAVVLLLSGLGIAYAATRPSHANQAGGPPPASASPTPTTPTSTTPTTSTAPPPAAPPATASATVPSLVGMPLPRAITMLRSAGLTGIVARVPSRRPPAQVVSQRPRAGAKLPRGGRVHVDVAIQQLIFVPDVTGIQGLVAVHTLQRDRLVASIRYVPSTEPARRVVSQWPSAGSKAKPGTVVRLNLSQGLRSKVAVPNVISEDEATARSDLVAAGFEVSSVDSPTGDPTEDGMVVAQSPQAGAQATRGSTVTIHVGRYSGG